MVFDPRYLLAEQLGIRLARMGGLALWEAHPPYRHQKAVDRIRASIRAEVGSDSPCVHVAGVYVRFRDASLTRPDISLFSQEPGEEEAAITLLPEAVIEVVSKGYEAKDLEIGPRFYLSQGVKDVVVFDPSTLLVLHVKPTGAQRLVSPVTLEFACGCTCTV